MAMPSPSRDTQGEAAKDPRLAHAVRSIVCISRVFEQVCREYGVSLPQYRLLLFLRHGPSRAGELAAMVAIKRPTLTALVAGLEKEGRLCRVADESDGRGVRIEITPKGMQALQAVEGHLAHVVDQLCSLGERESMLSGFEQISSIIDEEFERRVSESEATSG
jgi:DNA-binding MarR family transcriptional regulator